MLVSSGTVSVSGQLSAAHPTQPDSDTFYAQLELDDSLMIRRVWGTLQTPKPCSMGPRHLLSF